ncbi:MAG: sensor histidine kinase, partial [Gimesia chilikensis]
GLIGIVNIRFPSQKVEQAQNWNRAINVASALITAVLAMLAAYAIVRYVIVKPVLHLKDVSDEIAHGNLDLRADIRTGDEFEELSYAFNRMLRHLVTVQEELRTVNTDLDTKVDELAQVNLRLYEMNKLKDEFLATMSHELRTPLNSILGFSDLLANTKDLGEKQKRYVANIQMSGKNLLAQINDVLDLAKIESGKMELQLSELSIADLIERRAGTMLPLADKKNIELTSEIDPRIPILFQDSVKIQQILNNLLSNAIKFTPEGGRVHVSATLCEDDPELFDLLVRDNGIGIPLDEQEFIFEKFRQGKSNSETRDTMSRSYEGTGLGLSIIRELSKLLDGEVFLESEFGRGSQFTVRLPVRMQVDADNLLSDINDTSVGMNRLKSSDLAKYAEKLAENKHSESRTP